MGKIKTARKYENHVTFDATHKLFIDSNYKPIVRANDDASWNRLKLIPFTVTIPKERIDKTLLGELKKEGEGILAWVIEGCLRWQKEGVDDPEEVAAAIGSWRDEMDPLKDFFEDCCELCPEAYCSSSSLWQAYQDWAQANGERYTVSRRTFAERLERMGCHLNLHLLPH